MATQVAQEEAEKTKSRGETNKPHVIVHATPVRYETICQRAYDLYLQRGCVHGYHVEDWLAAEKELVEELIT
ncbi:MAG: hypothetical protein C0507_00950 [Cyanobacteria bacterium PR.3.49]|jgi:hypothetical protein|nr:hypothetical protein [Cyanobacteria bacterium PR.3.49]